MINIPPYAYAKEEWENNLQSEISFWEPWLKTRGGKLDRKAYKMRNDPEAKLQNIFLMYLDKTQGINKILDVGAGPLTIINKKCGFAEIKIFAVDSIADEYNKLLEKYNIQPIIRTQKCDGEKLTEKFDENTFDITYSHNALDHAYDPLKCIEEMIRVTKKGHYIIIQAFHKEGQNAEWSGLHKWNFFIERIKLFGETHLFLQGCDAKKTDITNLYKGASRQVHAKKGNNRIITAIYKKI